VRGWFCLESSTRKPMREAHVFLYVARYEKWVCPDSAPGVDLLNTIEYPHVLPNMQQDAVRTLEDALKL
jgi:hypothetical protein